MYRVCAGKTSAISPYFSCCCLIDVGSFLMLCLAEKPAEVTIKPVPAIVEEKEVKPRGPVQVHPQLYLLLEPLQPIKVGLGACAPPAVLGLGAYAPPAVLAT